MSALEARLVVETRQPDGTWAPAATLSLADEHRRETVAGWVTTDLTGAPDPGYLPRCDRDLWFLPDDALRGLLDGERGEQVGVQLARFLPDFDDAIAQRFGGAVLSEFYARRVGTLGHDADTFRNLPPVEQADFIIRLGQDDLPADH